MKSGCWFLPQLISMQLNTADRIVPGHIAMQGRVEAFGESEQRDSGISPAAQITSIVAENRELRGQVEQLRTERTRLTETQRRMMDLLHTSAPEKLVHDLRNLLNERDLLKTLVDQM